MSRSAKTWFFFFSCSKAQSTTLLLVDEAIIKRIDTINKLELAATDSLWSKPRGNPKYANIYI